MFLYSNKKKHTQSSDYKYIKNAVPMFLGMLVCIVCLAGSTWAWFTANVTTSTQDIQFATYSVNVEVRDIDENPVKVIKNESLGKNVVSCNLDPNQSYTIKLTPSVDITATKGYCVITDGTKKYTTGQLLNEKTFQFTYDNGLVERSNTAQEYDNLMENASTKEFTIAWYWGTYPETLPKVTTYSMEEVILLEDGAVIGQPIVARPEEMAELSLALTNVTADVESGKVSAESDCVITFTAAEGYELPESITVTGVEVYTYENGVLTIPADQMQDGTEIAVIVEAVEEIKAGTTLSLELTNVTADKESGKVSAGEDCVITFTAAEGYVLPKDITVSGVEGYTYENGVLTIPADQMQDGTEIVVKIEAAEIVSEETETTETTVTTETEVEEETEESVETEATTDTTETEETVEEETTETTTEEEEIVETETTETVSEETNTTESAINTTETEVEEETEEPVETESAAAETEASVEETTETESKTEA